MTTKQHVQLPNNMTKSGELSPKDLLVYVTIKSFMNKDSKECFPSIETIVERSGVSKPTVRKAIEALKREEYITVRTEGRRNIYKFSPYKTFEPFSYDFVKDKTIDANLKAYIIATQQLMFKDVNGYGKISNWTGQNAAIDAYLTFNKTFGDIHNINAMVGYSYEYATGRSSALASEDFIDSALGNENLGSGKAEKTWQSSLDEECCKAFCSQSYGYCA